MKMKPSGHDRPVRSHALIQTVGLLILAIICIALFAAGSVYLMQLLSSHGVMELKSDTAGAFFNVYANSVGLAIAFLAGLSTIILALQAIRVSMHQTRLSAREAFNDELAEFREQIGAADQMLHDIAAKSLRYAQEVSAHMKNNYHPTLASPPEEVEPVELVLSDERQEWLDGKLDELSVLNADIVDELFVARLCDDAGSAENDDPGRVVVSAAYRIETKLREILAAIPVATEAEILAQQERAAKQRLADWRNARTQADGTLSQVRSDWQASIMAYTALLASYTTSPILFALVRRNLTTRECQELLATLAQNLRAGDLETYEQHGAPIPLALDIDFIDQVPRMIGGPAVVDWDRPYFAEEEYELARMPPAPNFSAQAKLISRYLPRPGIMGYHSGESLGPQDGQQGNSEISYDPACREILICATNPSNAIPASVYAPDDRSISLTAIAGGMAKQSQSHKAVLKLSEGARFSTLIELLTRLVDTRDIRAALVDYLIDGGVERRFALQLADNYAKLFQRRQLRIESKPRPAHQPAA